jgi:hypothetical protein
MQSQRMPKQFATPAMEGTRKRRPRERWRDQVQEDIDIMGITSRKAIARDRWEGRSIMLGPRSTADCVG